MRILVADDEPTSRLVLEAYLHATAEVVLCADGNQACEAFGVQRFDLALLDLRMPGLSGLEVAQCLRALPGGADCKLIAMSARPAAEVDLTRGGVRWDGYLEKPVSRSALVKIASSFSAKVDEDPLFP